MYLGLAATAFLLVMLHPNKEHGAHKEPSSGAPPAAHATVQVCLASQRACCVVKALLQHAAPQRPLRHRCGRCKPASLH